MNLTTVKCQLANFTQKLKQFVYTDYFILTVGIVCLLSHLFGLELPAFYVLGIFAIFILVFCEDRQPLLPIMFLVCNSISIQHGASTTGSYDTLGSTLYVVNIAIISSLTVIAIIYSIVKNRKYAKANFKKINIRLGMLLMTIALLFNGINIFALSKSLTDMGFGNEYSFGTTMFGLLTALSFFAPFLYFFLTSNTDTFDIKYFAKNMTAVAILVSIQVIIRVISCAITGTLFVEGTHNISVGAMALGWGVANNVGAKLIMVLPMVFYLAIKEKHTAIYYSIAVVSTICIALTQSRNAMLFTIPLWIVAIVLMLIYCKNKKQLYICLGVSVGLALITIAVFFEQLKDIFWRLMDLITDDEGNFADNGRFAIWQRGLYLFTTNPIFGVGFLTPAFSPDHVYMDIYNNLYHNLFIQMLASCGIIGIIALYHHLLEVFKLFKKLDFDRAFIMTCIITALAINLLDVHIFMSSCSIFYSVYLVYSQKGYNDKFAKTVDSNTQDEQDTSEITLQSCNINTNNKTTNG